MTRWKAAGLHLTISATAACTIGALLFFLWFPAPYFVAAGASSLLLLLMSVDVCIGPLLTLIVLNPSKRASLIHLDMIVIVTIQAIAFAYGVYVICQARPAFVVGEVDRLVVVPADEISTSDLAKAVLPEANHISWTGPRLVGVVPPTGPSAFDVVSQALATGKDIDRLPQLYTPYTRVARELLSHALPLSKLKGLSSSQQKRLLKLQEHAKQDGYDLVSLPLERLDHFYTAIVRSDNAKPVAVLNIDPWK